MFLGFGGIFESRFIQGMAMGTRFRNCRCGAWSKATGGSHRQQVVQQQARPPSHCLTAVWQPPSLRWRKWLMTFVCCWVEQSVQQLMDKHRFEWVKGKPMLDQIGGDWEAFFWGGVRGARPVHYFFYAISADLVLVYNPLEKHMSGGPRTPSSARPFAAPVRCPSRLRIGRTAYADGS